MRRLSLCLSAVVFISGFVFAPPASAQQSVNLFVGAFHPRTEVSADDVLVRNGDFLDFNFDDFKRATYGGEWLVGLGDFFDAGLGASFYQRTAPAVYTVFVNANGSEIEQDLKLRIVPVTATIRFLPLGHHAPMRPYIGGGVGVINWRYSETGEFLDSDNNIFTGTFKGDGWQSGPVILGGVTIPIGPLGIGGEVRYQRAKAQLPASEHFAGSTIDLGGVNYLFVVNIRF